FPTAETQQAKTTVNCTMRFTGRSPAAAIDRLVHHSVIIEMNVPSYRVETAKNTRTKPSP
ncbi:MAG: hypothetical protein O2945_05115, partial [Planctomycetota bacterium]|nr:hypothetical protein [Planctomycetota bacterium]